MLLFHVSPPPPPLDWLRTVCIKRGGANTDYQNRASWWARKRNKFSINWICLGIWLIVLSMLIPERMTRMRLRRSRSYASRERFDNAIVIVCHIATNTNKIIVVPGRRNNALHSSTECVLHSGAETGSSGWMLQWPALPPVHCSGDFSLT